MLNHNIFPCWFHELHVSEADASGCCLRQLPAQGVKVNARLAPSSSCWYMAHETMLLEFQKITLMEITDPGCDKTALIPFISVEEHSWSGHPRCAIYSLISSSHGHDSSGYYEQWQTDRQTNAWQTHESCVVSLDGMHRSRLVDSGESISSPVRVLTY